MSDKNEKKAAGGHARARRLTSKQRSDIARKAAQTRWGEEAPQATHDGEMRVGDAVIFAAVLSDGTRLISQSTMLRALGRHPYPRAGQGGSSTLGELPSFLSAQVLSPFVTRDLEASAKPVFFRDKQGTRTVGYNATLLPQIAEVYLRFRDHCRVEGKPIPARYQKSVLAADILMRGLANVGIIALVDEATGFQRDRAADALSLILEKFIAKELRPWVKTFPDEFYEELFRLRGLKYPKDTVSRPQYFGHLTNDIIYKRLAPGVLDELKRVTPKRSDGRRRMGTFTQRLTEDLGHPKLREHMASVLTAMKLSANYDEFIRNLDRVKPRYGETLEMDLATNIDGL